MLRRRPLISPPNSPFRPPLPGDASTGDGSMEPSPPAPAFAAAGGDGASLTDRPGGCILPPLLGLLLVLVACGGGAKGGGGSGALADLRVDPPAAAATATSALFRGWTGIRCCRVVD